MMIDFGSPNPGEIDTPGRPQAASAPFYFIWRESDATPRTRVTPSTPGPPPARRPVGGNYRLAIVWPRRKLGNRSPRPGSKCHACIVFVSKSKSRGPLRRDAWVIPVPGATVRAASGGVSQALEAFPQPSMRITLHLLGGWRCLLAVNAETSSSLCPVFPLRAAARSGRPGRAGQSSSSSLTQ